MQTAVALAGEQQVEPVFGRLPGRDERAGQRLLPVAGGLGDLHVVGIEIAVADNPDLSDRVERLADDLEQRRAEIARDPQIACGTVKPRRRESGPSASTTRGEALDRHGLHPVQLQRFREFMRGSAFLGAGALRLERRHSSQGRSAFDDAAQ